MRSSPPSSSLRSAWKLALVLVRGLLVAVVATSPLAAQRLSVPRPAPNSPVWGGVPTGSATLEPLRLSLAEALRRALAYNLGVLIAEEAVNRAEGTRQVALSDLLPRFEGSVTETRRKTSLEVFGFPLGPTFPRVVGPYNVFDARVTLRQAIFDARATNDLHAESHRLAAVQLTRRSERDLIVLVAANVYLQTVAASARAEATLAQLETARALRQQAVELRAAGVIAGIDVVRSEVGVDAAQYTATEARNDFEKTKLQLARLIGLPVRQVFTIEDQVPSLSIPTPSFEEVLARAYTDRPDFLAAQARLREAESVVRGARAERLPSASLVGDYGVIGLTVGTSLPTFSVTGAVTVPLFDGGRASGRIQQAQADLAQRQAELEDLRASIYYNTRAAFLDLTAAEEQVQAATRGRELATLQLTQARDRLAAGVTNTVEVVQAQQMVAAAIERFIAAQYDVTVAKALVLSAPGSLEQAIAKYLPGSQP
jgi:outer membrane protein TolC